MDYITGIKSGLFCISIAESANSRAQYAKSMKPHLDDGSIIRETVSAIRDARYKIDWYSSPNVVRESDTLDYSDIIFFEHVIENLGIEMTFNPSSLKLLNGSKKFKKDIEICYGSYKPSPFKNTKINGYYFKYKGEANMLRFDYNGNQEDYNEFWKSIGGYVSIHKKFSDLVHEIHSFMHNFKLFN